MINLAEDNRKPSVPAAGWRISQWCQAIGLCRASFYNLEGPLRPESVKIGGAHIIIEAPDRYLKRIAVQQGIAAESDLREKDQKGPPARTTGVSDGAPPDPVHGQATATPGLPAVGGIHLAGATT